MSATEPPYNSHESNWTVPFPRAPQAKHADVPPFNSATDRAAEIMGALPMTKVWGTDLDGDPEWLWRYPTNEERAAALAAADPPLLITPEIQAVLDAAVEWRESGPWGGWTGDAVEIAVDAYLASRGEP